MNGPDEYELDEGLMDELGGAMDDFDSKKMKPVVIEISIHPHGKADVDEPKKSSETSEPTPEELDELMNASEA